MARTYIERLIRENKLQLTDAKAPLKVVITQNDIVNAKQLNSKCCAFALAAKKQPGVKKAYFFRSVAYLQFESKMVRFNLPASVRLEIESFDALGIVMPGVYNLAPPGKHDTLVAMRKKSRFYRTVKSSVPQSRRSNSNRLDQIPTYVRSMKEPK